MAQGTFYLYFKNKEQLLGELRRGVLQAYMAAFDAAVSTEGPADARLLAGLEAIHAEVSRQAELVRVFRQAATGEESERQVLAGRRRLAAPLGALIEEGLRDGVFEVDDPVLSAHFVISLLANLLVEAISHAEPAAPDTVKVRSARFVLRALGVPARRVDQLAPLEDPS